ncbi:MAG: alkaline phosphatase D family protein, partial [Bacteroidota bacterium]
MFKTALKIVAVLALAFVVFLFVQAGASAKTTVSPANVGQSIQPEVLTIAFGSCNRQDQPQDYWSTISSHAPYAWLWLGDNVYADTEDMSEMAADYAQQKDAAPYADFRTQVPHIYGIWDDHDYGINDGGKEWPHKDAAKELMLDFLEVPADAEVRSYAGGYQSYTLEKGGLTVGVILLDTRYFRDPTVPPTQDNHRYGQDSIADILGEAQWTWLEQTLRESSADVHVIGSSIQVIPQDHGYEKWDLFPAARTRLLDLVADLKPALPILLSGDRHLAEISQLQHQGFLIHEVTASGLTHSYEGANEPNRHRV